MGDVIVGVAGESVANMDEFARSLQKYGIGQTVDLKVRRGDQVRDVTVTIMDIS